jgi:hypothetical protein
MTFAEGTEAWRRYDAPTRWLCVLWSIPPCGNSSSNRRKAPNSAVLVQHHPRRSTHTLSTTRRRAARVLGLLGYIPLAGITLAALRDHYLTFCAYFVSPDYGRRRTATRAYRPKGLTLLQRHIRMSTHVPCYTSSVNSCSSGPQDFSRAKPKKLDAVAASLCSPRVPYNQLLA